MRSDSRIELRNRQIGGQRCPADARVHGAVHAPVVRQVEGVGAAQGVEYQMVLIHVHVARMGPLERLAAVFGDEQPYAGPQIEAVGVQRMHRKGQGIPADPIAAGALRIDFSPGRGTVVGAVDQWSAITPGVLAAVAYGGVQDIRSRGSDGQVDATDVRVTHAAGGTGPAAAAIGRLVHSVPSIGRIEDRRINRVHDEVVDDPRQNRTPGAAAVRRSEESEVRRREDRGRHRRSGRHGVDDDPGDLCSSPPVMEEDACQLPVPFPRRTPVQGPQYPAAVVAVSREVLLAGTGVDDVRIDRVDGDRAHGKRAFVVGHGGPGGSLVFGLPDAALRPTDVDNGRIARMDRDRRHATRHRATPRVVDLGRSQRPPPGAGNSLERDAAQGHHPLACDPHPGRDVDAAPGIGTEALVLQARENALAFVGLLGGGGGRKAQEGETEEEAGPGHARGFGWREKKGARPNYDSDQDPWHDTIFLSPSKLPRTRFALHSRCRYRGPL